MAKKIIKISVNDEYVTGVGVVIGAEGSDEAVALQVSFNDTWAGLNIYATFRDALGENPTAVMLMPSRLVLGENMTYQIDVPKPATRIAGKMSVVFSGFAVTKYSVYNAEENAYNKLVCRDALINTGNAYFRVLPSDFSVLDTKDKPEATLFESVLAEINALHGAIEEYEKTIEEQFDAHEGAVAATIGNLGTYENESGELIPYTVEGKLGAQDEKLAAQDEKVAAQDEKVDEVYTAYKNGELKGGPGEEGKPGPQGPPGVVEFVAVNELPTTNIKNAIYLVPSQDSADNNVYDEYIFVKGAWEKFSSTPVRVDLSDYVKKNTATWSRDIVYGQVKRNGAEIVMMVGEDPTASGVIPRFIKSVKDEKTSIVLRTQEPVNDTDCANKKYVDDIVGDVETALDAILAIQKELLGEITFTLYHGYTGTTDTLTAQKGMTWGEWCESEYNTIGAYIFEGATNKVVMHNVAGGEHYIHYEYGTPDYIEVYATNIIEEGHQYICPNWGV